MLVKIGFYAFGLVSCVLSVAAQEISPEGGLLMFGVYCVFANEIIQGRG